MYNYMFIKKKAKFKKGKFIFNKSGKKGLAKNSKIDNSLFIK